MFGFAGCGQIFQKRRFFSLQSIDRAVDIGCGRVEAELGGGRDYLVVLSANGDFKFIKWVHGRSPRAPDEFLPIRLPRESGPGQCVIVSPTAAAVAGRRARYDLAAMLALANGIGRRAFRLWPLDHYGCRYLENPAIIFLQPPCYSTPLSSYSYFCRSSCRSFFCWEGSASRCSP